MAAFRFESDYILVTDGDSASVTIWVLTYWSWAPDPRAVRLRSMPPLAACASRLSKKRISREICRGKRCIPTSIAYLLNWVSRRPSQRPASSAIQAGSWSVRATAAFIPFVGESGLQFGIQAWRSELDSILLAHARTAGVTVVQPAAGARGVSESRSCGRDRGGRQALARRAMWWTPQALAVGWRAVFSCPSKIFRHGWWRATRTLRESWGSSLNSANTLVAGPGWPGCAKIAANVFSSALSDAAPPPCDSLPPDVRFRGADVTWRLVPECAGAGYYLCGDAAAVLDPAASSGVARALASGLKAADLIVQVTLNRMDSLAAAALYRRGARGSSSSRRGNSRRVMGNWRNRRYGSMAWSITLPNLITSL